MFVNLTGQRSQIGEHGVANGSGHFGIGQCVQPDVNHCVLLHHFAPVHNRTRIGQIFEIRADQLDHATAGQFFQQGVERADQLFEITALVAQDTGYRITYRIVQVFLLQEGGQAYRINAAPGFADLFLFGIGQIEIIKIFLPARAFPVQDRCKILRGQIVYIDGAAVNQ